MAKSKTVLQLKWFKAFIDESNKTTFFNRAQSARAAGYKGTEKNLRQCGYINYKSFQEEIERWLEENGLAKAKLLEKEMRLLDAQETKLIKIAGQVDRDHLPEGVRVITQAKEGKFSVSGNPYDDYETILAIDMDALETQRRTLEMAKRGKGMYEEDNKQRRIFLNAEVIHKKDEGEDG